MMIAMKTLATSVQYKTSQLDPAGQEAGVRKEVAQTDIITRIRMIVILAAA